MSIAQIFVLLTVQVHHRIISNNVPQIKFPNDKKFLLERGILHQIWNIFLLKWIQQNITWSRCQFNLIQVCFFIPKISPFEFNYLNMILHEHFFDEYRASFINSFKVVCIYIFFLRLKPFESVLWKVDSYDLENFTGFIQSE